MKTYEYKMDGSIEERVSLHVTRIGHWFTLLNFKKAPKLSNSSETIVCFYKCYDAESGLNLMGDDRFRDIQSEYNKQFSERGNISQISFYYDVVNGSQYWRFDGGPKNEQGDEE